MEKKIRRKSIELVFIKQIERRDTSNPLCSINKRIRKIIVYFKFENVLLHKTKQNYPPYNESDYYLIVLLYNQIENPI